MRYDGANWVVHEGYWWRTDTEVEIHKSLMRGDISRASHWAGEDLSAYDSVQFPLFAPDQGNWMGETFTEVVMLRMRAEPNFLSEYVVKHAQDGSRAQQCSSDKDVGLSPLWSTQGIAHLPF